MNTSYAYVWAKYQTWERVYASRDVAGARTLSDLVSDPVDADDDADDDARQTQVFEVELVGTLAEISEATFTSLEKGQTLSLQGEIVYVTKRLSADLIEVYVDSRVAYEVVARAAWQH